MPLRVFSPGAEDAHAQPGHPERPDRIRAALAGVAIAPEAAAPATERDLPRAHAADHVARVRAHSERALPHDADTYATHGTWAAALRAAGSAIAAMQSARQGVPAMSLARPPGHHATRERAMGFCHVNHVAIAAHAAAQQGERVAIVDMRRAPGRVA